MKTRKKQREEVYTLARRPIGHSRYNCYPVSLLFFSSHRRHTIRAKAGSVRWRVRGLRCGARRWRLSSGSRLSDGRGQTGALSRSVYWRPTASHIGRFPSAPFARLLVLRHLYSWVADSWVQRCVSCVYRRTFVENRRVRRNRNRPSDFDASADIIIVTVTLRAANDVSGWPLLKACFPDRWLLARRATSRRHNNAFQHRVEAVFDKVLNGRGA